MRPSWHPGATSAGSFERIDQDLVLANRVIFSETTYRHLSEDEIPSTALMLPLGRLLLRPAHNPAPESHHGRTGPVPVLQHAVQRVTCDLWLRDEREHPLSKTSEG